MQQLTHYRQAILAAICGLALTLVVTLALRYIDNKNIQSSLQDELSALQSEIEREVQFHMFGLTWVARQHSAQPQSSGTAWLEDAESIHAYFPHFRSLLWVNVDGVIEGAYPPILNSEMRNERFSAHSGQSLSGLSGSNRYLIPAGDMAQHAADMLMVVSQLEQDPRGYYVGEINMNQLLRATTSRFLSEGSQFQIRPANGTHAIFEFFADKKYYQTWSTTNSVRLFDQNFALDLWPSAERLGEMRGRLPLFVVIAGLLSTGLLTFVLVVLGVSRVRAQELADTNLDLYAEIEERERVEKRMAYLAEHDWLTDLANRNALMEHLEKAMKRVRNTDMQVGALLIDLDNFKEVNDALGHTVGDALIKRVAERLSQLQGDNGILARMGGDEFAMTLTGIHSIGTLESLARNVIDALETHFIIDDYELYINASIGIAISQSDEDQGEDIMRNADTALYRAKERGRGTFHVYSHELHQELNDKIELLKKLRSAVENEKLTVYYQPKVDMTSRRVIGLEALVRWIDEDGSIIGPDRFIPLAEDTGLIIPISDYVLKASCAQLKKWHDAGFDDLQLSVNLSGKQLQSPDLIHFILDVIKQTKIPNGSLELELTEQVFIENIKSHTNFMHAVREHGMTLAIDDFGIGYSSLSYLKHFPVNALKVDRSFVRDLPDDKDDATITQTIINLANSLDIGIVAEGVETEEQLDFLLERGCTIGQGFLFSRPIPAEEMTELLTRYEGLVPIQID
ncbi:MULTISPECIES: bifunctional diguanylate cyclase/phosphodiesterase [Gammaproteobacteria]|uniref:putative bifunctional diguanylate cyclase/phosphodiesterase n=1 Tax=Gammaproteobacteria TaxID=1236 RepID=UPI000DD07058|nr:MULTISPECIES: EAL domain-containing protein [Gammaproteobacteria]RTE87382.1 EAL domain-containing protein [Aliidiomarina sp. B3213]TCZ92832.1 EAL domain-containing protein [Lysobacter sp. N42]